jgi:hypothetical protein
VSAAMPQPSPEGSNRPLFVAFKKQVRILQLDDCDLHGARMAPPCSQVSPMLLLASGTQGTGIPPEIISRLLAGDRSRVMDRSAIRKLPERKIHKRWNNLATSPWDPEDFQAKLITWAPRIPRRKIGEQPSKVAEKILTDAGSFKRASPRLRKNSPVINLLVRSTTMPGKVAQRKQTSNSDPLHKRDVEITQVAHGWGQSEREIGGRRRGR